MPCGDCSVAIPCAGAATTRCREAPRSRPLRFSADIETSFTGKGYGDFKKELVGVVQESLAPIQERFNDIRYSEELITVLKDGAERANAIAVPVLARVKERFGLGL